MKKVLSLLLAFVFCQVQAWALSGGPDFGNGSSALSSATGIYSGVLVPNGDVNTTATGTDTNAIGAAIGLFSLSQPDTGAAAGTLVVFIDGAPFTGTLSGLIDPSSGSLRAIISATSTYRVVEFIPTTTTTNGVTSTTFTQTSFPLFATGSVEAEVTQAASGGAVSDTRIDGTANVNVFFELNNDGTPDVSKTAVFTVDGFRQSTSVSGSTTDFSSAFSTTVGGTSSGG